MVTASGRLDGNASSDFAERVGGLIESVNPKLLIDFTNVDFVSSAGDAYQLVQNRATPEENSKSMTAR